MRNVTIVIPLLVIFAGIYISCKVRFFYLNPKIMLKSLGGILSKHGALGSLSLALAGTLGVGNIIGVAVGIRVGGAGSVFWLVLSAVPACAIKYAESALAADCASHSGMTGLIKSTFGRFGSASALIYSLFTVLLSLFMGAGLQSASFTSTLASLVPVSHLSIGIVLVILALPFVFFGMQRIKNATSLFVAAATSLYIILALIVIFPAREALPSVFCLIFTEVFNGSAAAGGVLGFSVSYALKEGFLRGILSNEAGLGTSSLAHADSACYTPHEAGVIGVLEVVCDTVILCPLTALMLLVAGDGTAPDAVSYVLSAVRRGGTIAEYLFAVALFFFAFSTVICWATYGRVACKSTFSQLEIPFRIAFLVFVLLGALTGAEMLVGAVDFIMLPLAVISISAVIKSSDRVSTLSESCKNFKRNIKAGEWSKEP